MAYSNFYKILNIIHFLFSNEMMVYRAETHKTLVRKANKEDPD